MLSESAFHDLYRQSAAQLRNYIVRTMGTGAHADDILQEAYLRILRHPPAANELPVLRAYLYRVASNLITDRWRKHKYEVQMADTPASASTDDDADLSIDMQRTFLKMRPLDRQLMWLAYVEGESHREIADNLGLKERSIRVLLLRARRKLAELLQPKHERPPERAKMQANSDVKTVDSIECARSSL